MSTLTSGSCLFERLLRLQAFLAAHAAVDDDHSLLAAEQSGDASFEVAQRIAMLGKNNELLARRRFRRRNCAGTIGGRMAACSFGIAAAK